MSTVATLVADRESGGRSRLRAKEDRLLSRLRLSVSADAVAIVLIVALWLRGVGALVALSYTVEKRFVVAGDEALVSALSSAVSQGFYILVIAICAAAVLFRLNDITRPGLGRIAIMLLPWLWLMTRNAYSGLATADSLLYPFLILALAALRPSPKVLGAVGILVGLTGAAALAMGAFSPDAGILHEADGEIRLRDKETIPGWGLLQGMFTSENSLGQFLSIGFASILFVRPVWLRVPLGAAALIAIYWSSSRSSFLTLIVSLGAASIVWFVLALGFRRFASRIARVAIAVCILVVTLLPLYPWSDDAFTDRGVIWTVSLAEWGDRAGMFGFASDWYGQMAQTETSPLHGGAVHGHNEVVQLLVTGGFVLALLAFVWIAAVSWELTDARRRWIAASTALVMAIVASGTLEVSISFVDRSVLWSVSIVPVAILFFSHPRDRSIGEETTWQTSRTIRRPT